MVEKLQTFISRTAYVIYGVLFGFIFYAAMFNNTAFEYDSAAIFKYMGLVLLYLAALLLVYRLCWRFIYKYRYIFLVLVCALVFRAQYNVGNNIVHWAIYDHERVLHGAMMWAQGITGEEFAPYSAYVHYYTNNLGLFMVQQRLFKLGMSMGCTNLYTVAIFTGHIIFAVMLVTSFMYLDENISGHRAVFFLFTITLYLPLYFQSSISYTDTYSVWGIPCLLFLISRGIRADSMVKKIIYALLTAPVMAVAVQIKTTVAIVAIALLIQMAIHNLQIKNAAFFAVLLAGFVGCYSAFNHWTYSTVRDPARDMEAMPVTHWLMMGLQGDGAYNGTDEHRITLSVPPEKRVEKNIEVIKQRLEDMGPEGYMQLLYRKTCRTFGSGNAEVYYTFKYDESDTTPFNFVYECTLEEGRYYPYLNLASQTVYMTAVLLGVAGAVLAVIKKYNLNNFAPHVALIGFWMFMMLWESNHRQLINQWSLLFMASAIGLANIWQLLLAPKEKQTVIEEIEKDKVF